MNSYVIAYHLMGWGAGAVILSLTLSLWWKKLDALIDEDEEALIDRMKLANFVRALGVFLLRAGLGASFAGLVIFAVLKLAGVAE